MSSSDTLNMSSSDTLNMSLDMSSDVSADVSDVSEVKKKIIWKKKEPKQEFPFMNGSKILFDFLIRPYLDDRTLGLIAGTCVAAREYVTKDLESHWFQKYLELYERGVIEKYVRHGTCCSYCFSSYNLGYHNYNSKELCDQNDIWWDDIPVQVYNLAKADGYHSYKNKYEGKKVCRRHLVPKYLDSKHKSNKSKKRSHMNYYKKVMFYDLYHTNQSSLNNRIAKCRQEYEIYQALSDTYKKKLKNLERDLKFLEIIKN